MRFAPWSRTARSLTAATLLAAHGVRCVVLERWPSIYPQPRAVHLHGFPAANMFDQPQLEDILRTNLKRFEQIELVTGDEVTGLDQDENGIDVHLRRGGTGAPGRIRARYVLGCDGANSVTRSAIGSSMRDLKFAQRWLVVDLATDADLGHWEGVHQVCDPGSAATFMRIGQSRYRWEFQLRDGRSAQDYQQLGELRPLIDPWNRAGLARWTHHRVFGLRLRGVTCTDRMSAASPPLMVVE